MRLTPLWNSEPAKAAQLGAGSKSVREAATLPKLATIRSPCHEKLSDAQQPLKRGAAGGAAGLLVVHRPRSARICALVRLTPWCDAFAAAATGPSVLVSASSTVRLAEAHVSQEMLIDVCDVLLVG